MLPSAVGRGAARIGMDVLGRGPVQLGARVCKMHAMVMGEAAGMIPSDVVGNELNG